MSTLKMYVEYDQKKKRLTVECNFMMNALMKKIPSRKFDARRKIWLVPLCRQNVIGIKELGDRVVISAVAQEAINRHTVKTAIPPTAPFPVMHQFKTNPFNHQRDALALCWNKPVFGLFMEMGTGKSKVINDKAEQHYTADDINALIVYCPVGIRSNWVEQLFIHCRSLHNTWRMVGGEYVSPAVKILDLGSKSNEHDLEGFLIASHPFKVLIVGIESLSGGCALQGIEKAGRAFQYVHRFALAHRCMQAVDEAHNIKGHDSNRAINTVELGKLSQIRLVATGTPILQSLLDLFMYFEFLDPNIIGIGDYNSFKARYALLSEDGYKRVVDYDNVEELMSLVQPHVYQCTKEEVLKDLPPKMYQTRKVTLSKPQREAYDAIKKTKMFEKGDSIKVVVDNCLAAYSALQTITGGFINYDKMQDHDVVTMLQGDKPPVMERVTEMLVPWKQNPKIQELLAVLEENGDRPCIIWACYTFEILQIAEALRATYGPDSTVEYYGAVDLDERDVRKRKFLEGKAKYFVANQKAGGVGLTLNVASLVVYMSNTFKYVDRVQSEDRNHRIGQDKSVLYVDIVASNTVDLAISRALAMKKDLADWVKDQLAERQEIPL